MPYDDEDDDDDDIDDATVTDSLFFKTTGLTFGDIFGDEYAGDGIPNETTPGQADAPVCGNKGGVCGRASEADSTNGRGTIRTQAGDHASQAPRATDLYRNT